MANTHGRCTMLGDVLNGLRENEMLLSSLLHCFLFNVNLSMRSYILFLSSSRVRLFDSDEVRQETGAGIYSDRKTLPL